MWRMNQRHSIQTKPEINASMVPFALIKFIHRYIHLQHYVYIIYNIYLYNYCIPFTVKCNYTYTTQRHKLYNYQHSKGQTHKFRSKIPKQLQLDCNIQQQPLTLPGQSSTKDPRFILLHPHTLSELGAQEGTPQRPRDQGATRGPGTRGPRGPPEAQGAPERATRGPPRGPPKSQVAPQRPKDQRARGAPEGPPEGQQDHQRPKDQRARGA